MLLAFGWGLLKFVQNFQERRHIVVLVLGEGQVDEIKGVQRPVGCFVNELELDEKHVLLQLGFLVWRRMLVRLC